MVTLTDLLHGIVQQVTHRPDAVGQTEGHGRCSAAVAPLQSMKRNPQTLMRTGKMIVSAKPFAVHEQMALGLGISPGAPRQAGDALTESEVDALDKSSLDEPPQADRLQFIEQMGAFAVSHAGLSDGFSIFVLALDEHAVLKIIADTPVIFASARGSKPRAEMCGDGIEVSSQTIGQKGGDVAGSEPDFDIVGEGKGVVFGATADVKRWDRFADRDDSQPEPASRGDAANAGIEFIELKHDEDQIAKELVVPALRMATHAVKPASDGGVSVTSEADHNGQIDAFG
jgi:hypothetical protein